MKIIKQSMRKVFVRTGHLFVLSCLSVTLLVFGSPGVATAADVVTNASPHSVLQQDVNHIRDIGTVGVLAETTKEVAGNTHITRARAGTAVRNSPLPVDWQSHFRIGSTTKTYVATVVLQLEAEGKLSLNDTVDTWLPGLISGNGNDGQMITIKQLLGQTSGLYDYVVDDEFLPTIITPEAFYANRFNNYTPQQLVGFAVSNPPDFAPGTSWGYSNTNYIVAGMIIKAVTGESWNAQVKKRIIVPLGLSETSAPGSNPFLPFPHPRGYESFTDGGAYYDTTEHNMTWAGPAGALISTPRDTSKFFRALMKGQLLPPSQLVAMQTTVPMGEVYDEIWPGAAYGLGIMSTNLPCGGEYWHHGGDVIGYSVTEGVTADGTRSAMVASSTNTLGDFEFAAGSLQYTNELVWNALCGYDTDPSGSSVATPPAADLRRRAL